MAVQRTLIGNIKGPKGDKGDTGDTGARGAGATVTIGSVTTTAYGGNANVTNSGTATDAVFDFVLPQGAPGETVTDMENLTLSSMTEPSVQFPIPSIGDTGKVVFGKITKWFSDMTALVATKLNASNVVNNLTTTDSGYALDARQGKALYDILSPYIKVVATAQVTTETVWSNVQKAALVAPTVSGYKFLCWIGVETIGSVSVGYIASPYQANTNAFYPQQTANLKVAGTALYIRNI